MLSSPHTINKSKYRQTSLTKCTLYHLDIVFVQMPIIIFGDLKNYTLPGGRKGSLPRVNFSFLHFTSPTSTNRPSTNNDIKWPTNRSGRRECLCAWEIYIVSLEVFNLSGVLNNLLPYQKDTHQK